MQARTRRATGRTVAVLAGLAIVASTALVPVRADAATTAEGLYLDPLVTTNLGSGLERVDATVEVLEILPTADGGVLVGGTFSEFDGSPVPANLIKLDADGRVDPDFAANLGSGFDEVVMALAVSESGDIYVGGGFATLDGSPVPQGLVRLGADGTLDASYADALGSGFSARNGIITRGYVDALTLLSDGRLLVGGLFDHLDDGPVPELLVKLDPDGTVERGFANALGTGLTNDQGEHMGTFRGVTRVIELPDGDIVVGGLFDSLNGHPIGSGLVKLTERGALRSEFSAALGTGFDEIVYNMAVDDVGGIVATGVFTTVGDTPVSSGLARVRPDGTVDTSFSANLGTGFEEMLLAIQFDGSGFVVGGIPFMASSSNNPGIFRVESDGTLDVQFASRMGTGFDGAVWSIALTDDHALWVGGEFETLDATRSPDGIVLIRDGAIEFQEHPDVTSRVGEDVEVAIAVTASAPVALSADGLPAGVRLEDGALVGSPTEVGTSTVTLTAALGDATLPLGALVASTTLTWTVDVENLAELALGVSPVLVDDGNGTADPGESISFEYTVTNTGPVALTHVAVTDPASGLVTCATTDLAVAGSTTCTSVPRDVTEADLLAGAITSTATATAQSATGPTTARGAATIATTPAAAGLALTLVADLDDANGNGLADVGEAIGYAIEVTSTGNLTLTDLVVTDDRFGTATCATTTLLVGASTSCATGSWDVRQADLLAGAITSTATATAQSATGPTTARGAATIATTPAAAGLALTLVADLDDANGNGLADVGEAIGYAIEVTSTGNLTLTDLVVTDELVDSATCAVRSLLPGQTTTCTTETREVVEADLLAGAASNVANATAQSAAGPVSAQDSARVATVRAGAGLALTLVADLDDANSNGLADVGETIGYAIEVTSTGNLTLTDLVVTDDRFGATSCTTSTLAPGASTSCATGSWVVTEDDLVAGLVSTAATGTAQSVGGPVSGSDSANVSTTPAAAGLDLVLVGDLDDLDGNGLADTGETVGYQVRITNTGNLTLRGLSATDRLAGAIRCPHPELAPGQTTSCSAGTWTVTEADLLAGEVLNIATATADSATGPVTADRSDRVGTTPAAAGLSLALTADLMDRAGDAVGVRLDVGETIDHEIAITNIGNLTLTDLGVVVDPALAVSCADLSLAPGRTIACTTAVRTVTYEDLIAGEVAHTATATAQSALGDRTATDSVSVPTVSRQATITVDHPVLLAGDTQVVRAQGFAPGRRATAVLHSDAVEVGTITVAPDGTARLEFVVPAATAIGDHTITLTDPHTSASAAFEVAVTAGTESAADDPEVATRSHVLAVTGFGVTASVLVALAALLLGGLLIIRRNRGRGVRL